jgi:hypothetical protein
MGSFFFVHLCLVTIKKVVFFTNKNYIMKKFLKVDTASNGTLIIPADKMVWIATNASTQTLIYQLGAGDEFDIVTITHADDSAAAGNTMIAYIQDMFIEVAQSKWSESVLDITANSPKLISNVTFA